jgi:hypothetical protein
MRAKCTTGNTKPATHVSQICVNELRQWMNAMRLKHAESALSE